MRIVVALVAFAAFTASCFAQQREIDVQDTIDLKLGQVRAFLFDRPFSRISLTSDTIARVTPETDQTLTVEGLKPGTTLLTVYGNDGAVVLRSNIVVNRVGAGLVKIYGQNKDKRGDYIGAYCTSTGCGRQDDDVPPVPFETSISETVQRENNTSVTTTKRYR